MYYSDGSEEKKEVKWAEIPIEKLEEIGIFNLSGSIKGIDLKAEAYEKSGAISNNDAAHALKTNLTAVARYEEKEQAEKVVKQMNGFKLLLEHQMENKWIAEKAYQEPMLDADHLIKKC